MPAIAALKGVQIAMKQKFPTAKVMEPDYFKQSDVNSTSIFYSQTTVLKNGKSIAVQITCVYIPFCGSTYEIGYTVETGNKSIHRRFEVNQKEVCTEGVLNILRKNGLKI